MKADSRWFLHDVASEVLARGFTRLDFRALARAKGVSERELRGRFPDTHALSKALIDEILTAYKEEIFHIAKAQPNTDSNERLIQMLAASFEYYENRPLLMQVVINALLGTDESLREHVHGSFEGIGRLLLEDLLDARVIPAPSRRLIADFADVMLSVIFLGGCPELEMDYLSYLDPRRIAEAAIRALRARYHSPRFAH